MDKKRLELLSDLEVNKLVAKEVNAYHPVPKEFKSDYVGDTECYFDERRVIYFCHDDYCNNPEDIMPIAIENKIGLLSAFDVWYATVGHYTQPAMKVCHENPYRAICILFLLMQ